MSNPQRYVSTARMTFASAGDGPSLELLRAECNEGLNTLYTITAEVLCRQIDFSFADALGKDISIASAMTDTGQLLREFNGILTDAQALRYAKDNVIYRLTLRPRLYLFDHNRDYRIFQDLTTKDIVAQILADRRIDARFSLQGSYTPRPYTVQYGESDFAFISRLIEEDGIAFVFVHKDQKHTIEFTDTPTSRPAGRVSTLTFDGNAHNRYADAYADQAGTDAFATAWQEVLSSRGEGKVSLTDFDFETPDSDQLKSIPSVAASNPVEIYDFPAVTAHKDFAAIEPRATARMRSIEAGRAVYTGQAQTTALTVGSQFTLNGALPDRFAASYMITQLKTIVLGDVVEIGNDAGAGAGAWFSAVKTDVKWAPPQVTPRPVARGPETAIVTGPADETIFTDKYGRVKVQFHWDRTGKKDEKTTCWIRVSQTGGLGNIILPRVGHEVVVDFIDGNPDRPLVVGRVFNGNNMPHYAAEQNKTRAVWRSKSYKNADSALDEGAVDFEDFKKIYAGQESETALPPPGNEFRFEDLSGQEAVLIHAHRDMLTRTRNKHFLYVGQDEKTMVGHDEAREVGRDFSEKIARNVKIDIGGKEELTTTGDRTETLKAKHTITTTGETSHQTEAAISVTVRSGDYTLKTSSGSITAEAGQNITIKAPAGISIECGSSKITMTPASIKIEAVNIEIAGQATTKVSASGMVQVQGGIIKLN